MGVYAVNKIDATGTTALTIQSEHICMLSYHKINSAISKESCVIALVNGVVMAIDKPFNTVANWMRKE